MALSISVASPTQFSEDGGHQIEVTGVFVLGNQHRIHIGATGTASDPQCHSGKAGQGNILYPVSATLLRGYTPAGLPPGASYDVYVVDLDTSENDSLTDEVTIEERQYYTKVYSMRKQMPPYYKTGPRIIDQEPL